MEIVKRCIDCPLKEIYKKDCGINTTRRTTASGCTIIKRPDNRCKLKFKEIFKENNINHSIDGKRF